MTEWETQEIVRLKTEYGTVPPPWTLLPGAHPYSPVWRTGQAAAWLELWKKWWHEQFWWQAEQFAYLQRFPAPAEWLEWVIFALWPDAEASYKALDKAAQHGYLKPYFQRLKALNFGSYEEWSRAVERGF